MALAVRQLATIAFADSATDCAISFSSLPLAGSLIVVLISDYDGTGTLSAADNQSGNTYSLAESGVMGQYRPAIMYARNIGSPGGTFTVTVSASTGGHYFCLGMAEVTGAETGATCLDQHTTATANSNAASITTSTLDQADEIVFAVAGDTASDSDHGYDRPAATGFTAVMTENDGGTHIPGVGDYKIVSSTSAVTCNWGTLTTTYTWGAAIATFRQAAGGGGGTINTQTLTDTVAVADQSVSGAVRNALLSDALTVAEGSTVISKIYGVLFSDDLIVTDQSAQFFMRTRLAESQVVVTDEALASVIGNAVLTRVLSDSVDVTDGAVWSAIRGRIMQDAITVSEGTTDQFITTNLLATDELELSDGLTSRLWFTRLLTESLNLTDEAVASVIGQNVLTRVLTDSISTVDEAVLWCSRQRLGESMVLTTDEVVKVLLWTRSLTDAVELSDQALSTFQRFILLTDALSVDDSYTSVVAGASVSEPAIVTGFDQPRIDIGGYAL